LPQLRANNSPTAWFATLHAARVLLIAVTLLLAARGTCAQFQQPLVFSSGGAVAVRDDTTGLLTPVSGSPFQPTNENLTIDVQGRYLFGIGTNSIHMYEITDAGTGAYQEVANSPFASMFTMSPTFIAVEPSGNYIAVVNQIGPSQYQGSVETFQISPNAAGGPALVPVVGSYTALDSNVIGASQPASGATAFYLYLGMEFPSGSAYNTGEELDFVSISPTTGMLQGLGVPGYDNSTARCYASDPQGRYIVTGHGEYEGSLELIGIDGKFQGATVNFGQNIFPDSVWVDSTGTFLYVITGAGGVGPVQIYSLNLQTYTLTETASSPLPNATFVPSYQPDPTGPFNYGSSGAPSSISAYTVDPVTGYFVPVANSPFNIPGSGSLSFSIVPGSQGVSGPSIQIAPTTLSLGTLQIGTPSAPHMITLTSNGAEALSVNSIAVSGADASEFLESDTCQTPAVLQPNKFCSISIIFTPSGAGTQSATVTITDNAPGSPQAVQLSGAGVAPPPPAPAVTIAPNPVTFASVTQGTTSSAMNIVVSNSGNATLHISSVAAGGNNPGDFENPASNCSDAALAANATCVISVTFAPLAAGQRSETITLTDDAANSPQVIMVQGDANPTIAVGPTSTTTATVSAGATAQFQLQINPGANYSGTVSLACSGAPMGATCQMPSSIQVGGGVAAMLNVSVTTSGAATLIPVRLVGPWRTVRLTLFQLALLYLIFFLLLWNGRQAFDGHAAERSLVTSKFALGAGVLAFALITLIAGCGGSGGATNDPPPIVTPQGTSTITITPSAKSGSGQALVLPAIQLTLTVQ
jgi:hypothetical protein